MAWVKNRFEMFVRIDPARTHAYLNNPVGQVQPNFAAMAESVAERAQQLVSGEMVNVVTGRLRDGIRVVPKPSPAGGIMYDIESTDPKTHWIHSGTRLHFIEPVNARVLKFPQGGTEIFRPRSLHPGTQPKPFLNHALREVVGASQWF